MIEFVCFDLGGVLVRICNDFGTLVKRAKLDSSSCKIKSFQDIDQYHFFQRYQLGSIPTSSYLEQLSALTENSYSKEEMHQIHDAILIEPYGGTLKLIQKLQDHSLLTGCLSNTNESHFEIMTKTDQFLNVKILEKKFASHELQLEKPDPAIYKAVEDETGIKPKGICYFDDKEEHVKAALDRGWSAFLIDPYQETAPQLEAALISLKVFSEE